jgi:pimeloyl-ACP methyl ester carboxylesterase
MSHVPERPEAAAVVEFASIVSLVPVRSKEVFSAAYDAVLAQWPVPVEPVDVPSAHGTTRVHVAGPTNAQPLLLIHGGGATSTVWFANVAELTRSRRVYAPDVICDVGRSVPSDRPVRSPDDLMAWLDVVLDDLGVETTDVCGHSYGGWMALAYAMHAPPRVGKLVLLDPTECFAGFRPGYLMHALPVLLRPSAKRQRRFLSWETGERELNKPWLDLVALGAELPRPKIVRPRRPTAAQLEAIQTPTLVLLGEKSKAHRIEKVAARARQRLPNAVTDVLPGASHHSIPTDEADNLNHRVSAFLG